MKPAWLTAFIARPRLNAARDRRQALRCIDTASPIGSWQAVLDSGAHSITVLPDAHSFEAALNRRLALRKAARLEANPHKRGWITRAINGGAR